MLRRCCIDCIRWPRPQYMRPGLFLCLVGESVGRSILEGDGDDAAIVHNDVVDDLLEEAARDGGVNGSDVLLVVDVAVFNQLVRHDVVAGLADEVVAQLLAGLLVLQLLDAGIDFFELLGDLPALHDEVFLGHGLVIVEVEGVQTGEGIVELAAPSAERVNLADGVVITGEGDLRAVLHGIAGGAKRIEKLAQSVGADRGHVLKRFAAEQLTLQNLGRRGLRGVLGGPDDVGNVVQDKRAERGVGDVLVGTGGSFAPSAATGVLRGAEAVCPAPVEVGCHVGAALAAAEQAGKDVDVLPDVCFVRGDTTVLIPCQQELYAIEHIIVQNGFVVILNGDPLVGVALLYTFAVRMDVVDVS